MPEVRLFAALRDAAGEGRTRSDAPTLAVLLDELRDRYGPRFTERLERAAVTLDGEPVPRDSDRSLEGVDEVALLPPFAGG